MRQIMFGLILYADENADYLAWAGDVDRDLPPDWVFGGQPSSDTTNQRYWSQPPLSYGFHAEAGSVFTHVTSQPQIRLNGRVDLNHTNSYPVYRCPSSGLIGRAQRVNFSMNNFIDGAENPPKGVLTTELSIRRKDPVDERRFEDNANASFHPAAARQVGLRGP